MSAQLMRDGSLSDLEQTRAEFATLCTTRREDTLDQIRFNQGVAHGIELAKDIIQQRYDNLYG